MEPIQFKGWQKIGRLRRNTIASEKLDGASAAIGVVELERGANGALPFGWDRQPAKMVVTDAGTFLLYCQNRTRIVTPGGDTDNYGFAAWAYENAETLALDLGPGLHFGEWWGLGIQRGYGQKAKRLSLFNTSRWAGNEFTTPNLGVVPVVGYGPMGDDLVNGALDLLRREGSIAAPGFMNPEGIVLFHAATHSMYKVTLSGDDAPKTQASELNRPLVSLRKGAGESDA
jgi:hypothetical protein